MDDLCSSSLAVNGEHDGEYHETNHGEVWERCRNCNSLFFVRFHDTGSGC